MNLTRYIAKWGWASLFILFWIRLLGWWVGTPALLLAGFLVFGGITAASTLLYLYGLWRLNRMMKMGGWIPYE